MKLTDDLDIVECRPSGTYVAAAHTLVQSRVRGFRILNMQIRYTRLHPRVTVPVELDEHVVHVELCRGENEENSFKRFN